MLTLTPVNTRFLAVMSELQKMKNLLDESARIKLLPDSTSISSDGIQILAERVSAPQGGRQANGKDYDIKIKVDGKYVSIDNVSAKTYVYRPKSR